MQRWSSIAFGALACVAFAIILWQTSARHVPKDVATPAWSIAPPPALPSLAIPAFSLPPLPVPAPPLASHPLPPGSPKSVRFGVVLVQHRAAELAPDGARTKAEALGIARSLADVAKRDFKEAVARGDPGSTEDAGRVGRGILEPNVEYDLFTLPVGGVSDPIDTPRGFWIAKRID